MRPVCTVDCGCPLASTSGRATGIRAPRAVTCSTTTILTKRRKLATHAFGVHSEGYDDLCEMHLVAVQSRAVNKTRYLQVYGLT